ncbi:MAG: hypothetical protein UD963_03950, partial [Christensenellales bacterium]|nr:hypothetical protein [Christensenellales bacterium]
VRQMLSQLSYAPELATPHRLNVSSAATRYIIHEPARFVNCFLKILQNKIKQGEITRIFPSQHRKDGCFSAPARLSCLSESDADSSAYLIFFDRENQS